MRKGRSGKRLGLICPWDELLKMSFRCFIFERVLYLTSKLYKGLWLIHDKTLKQKFSHDKMASWKCDLTKPHAIEPLVTIELLWNYGLTGNSQHPKTLSKSQKNSQLSQKNSQESQKNSQESQKNSQFSQKNSQNFQKNSQLSQKNSQESQKNSQFSQKTLSFLKKYFSKTLFKNSSMQFYFWKFSVRWVFAWTNE